MIHVERATPEVLIVGAGPAGLACAIAAARKGLQVEVVDGMKPPIDKACGEGLLPDALEALAEIGLSDPAQALQAEEGYPLKGVRFIDVTSPTRTRVVEAAFPKRSGLGIRRTVLHRLLLERAISLGIKFHWENSVQSIEHPGGGSVVRTNRKTFHCWYLVGADGLRSRVAAWTHLSKAGIYKQRTALRQHYAIAPWTSFVEVYWSDFGQAYVTPTSTGEICVAFIAQRKIPTPAEALRHFPALEDRLQGVPISGSARGALTMERRLPRVTTRGVALAGDASGSVDAITGQGLALCFREAISLADALHQGDLKLYERAHRKILRLPGAMSHTLLMMDRSSTIRRIAMSAMSRHGILFERLLKMHIGHCSQRPSHEEDLLAVG